MLRVRKPDADAPERHHDGVSARGPIFHHKTLAEAMQLHIEVGQGQLDGGGAGPASRAEEIYARRPVRSADVENAQRPFPVPRHPVRCQVFHDRPLGFAKAAPGCPLPDAVDTDILENLGELAAVGGCPLPRRPGRLGREVSQTIRVGVKKNAENPGFWLRSLPDDLHGRSGLSMGRCATRGIWRRRLSKARKYAFL